MTAHSGREDSYNFEVADTHTYFVGRLGALVHNTCSAKDLLDNGGACLDGDTIIGGYGNKFVRQSDGSFAKVGAATDSEIAQAGVTVKAPEVGAVGTAAEEALSVGGGGSGAANAENGSSLVNPTQVDTLIANGVKVTPGNVVATGTTPSGQIVFLETGNSRAGLQHIIDDHGADFANIGVSETQIPSVVMQAVQKGNIVGYQGAGTGRPIYQITINGQPQNIAVTVGSNGFIVGANPTGKMVPK